ncbi:hypothetical protein M0R45_037977 [Rubus argutus]|uniref:Uncharacterized protein n=1 Tax=Rubus argutus TaxID=59490 RepID=A0AAW1W3Q3_RUBAR
MADPPYAKGPRSDEQPSNSNPPFSIQLPRTSSNVSDHRIRTCHRRLGRHSDPRPEAPFHRPGDTPPTEESGAGVGNGCPRFGSHASPRAYGLARTRSPEMAAGPPPMTWRRSLSRGPIPP